MKNEHITSYLSRFGDIPLPKGHISWLQNTAILTKEEIQIHDDLQFAGTILGRVQKNRFSPSFPLLDHIAKHTKQKLLIDDKMAYLFTCGRDIFKKQVPQRIDEKVVLVLNMQNEVLGVAIQQDDLFKNVFDRGIFLRQEMGKKR